MKKLSLYLSLVVLILGSFYACDKIEEPFFKPVYTDQFVLSELVADASTLSESQYNTFKTLISSNSNAIQMLVLSGDTSVAGNTQAAFAWLSQFQLNTQDNLALFNRVRLNSSYGQLPAQWENALNLTLTSDAEYNLSSTLKLNEISQQFEGNISITALNGNDFSCNAHVYIVSDSILVNGFYPENVLQKSIPNAAQFDKLKRGETSEKHVSIDLSQFNNMNVLSAIVVIENSLDNSILQVTEIQISGLEFSTKQKFLIEDFTGHQCGFCPNAHIELASLHNLYGDQIVPLAIHYGYYTEISTQYPTNFITPIATHIGDYFAIPYTPVGMVNRMGATDNKLVDHGNWGSTILGLKDRPSSIGLIVTAEVVGGKIEATTYIKAFGAQDTLLKIQYLIAESHIIAPQLFYNHQPSSYIPDYEHNHVLRTSANGLWGEDLITPPLQSNQIISKTLSYNVSSEWNADNLHLIVIVYNDVTKEILQVESTDL